MANIIGQEDVQCKVKSRKLCMNNWDVQQQSSYGAKIAMMRMVVNQVQWAGIGINHRLAVRHLGSYRQACG